MFKSTVTPRIQPGNTKKGVIVRVSCRNFITYNEVEVCPGEDLNIILGPNGTGKSTLVNAIILGLAGKTKLIGRSEDLSAYIKIGQKFFEVEIELNNPNGDNFIISRKYTREKESTWMLNGKKVPLKKIETIVRECKIQVDNLCQFLPQDRVQDFAKMNSKELLEQTQRSIDNGELAEQLNELKAQRKEQIEVQKQLDVNGKSLEAEVQKNVNLEGEVRNAEEREKLAKKIELMKQKQAHLLIDIKKDLIDKLKIRLREKNREHEGVIEIQRSFEREIATAKTQQTRQENTLVKLTKDAKDQLVALSTLLNKSTDVADRIEDEKTIMKNQLRDEEKREEEIRAIDVHIERLMNDLPESDGSDQQAFQTVSAQIQSKKQILLTKQGEIEDMKSNITTLENELRAIDGRIAGENNAKNANMDLLRSRHRGLYDAVVWLRANKDKFRGEVYEPMFTQINVQDGYSKYLENAIANRDLLAFTCEYGSDTSKLIQEFKDNQKLHGINIITAPEKIMRGGKEVPTKEANRPRVPLEQIKQFGFKQYLLDTVDGPEPILRILAKNNLHNIPVGSAAVNKHVDNIPASFNLYFSDDSRYNSSKSRYSGKALFSNSAIGDAHYLKNNVNKSRLQEYENNRQEVSQEKESLILQRNQLQSNFTVLNSELNDLTAQRNQIKQKIDQQRIVRSKIEQKQKQRREREQSKIDPESVKLNFKENAKRLVQDFIRARNNILRISGQIENSSGEMKLHKLVLVGLKDTVRNKTRELNDHKKSTKDQEEELRKLRESIEDEQENGRRLVIKANELCKGVKKGSREFEPIEAEFRKLPNNLDDLESDMVSTQAKVDILAGTSNTESLLEYETRKKHIKELEKKKDVYQNRLDEIAGKMGTLRERWYPRVKDLVSKIDAKFRGYFDSFQCGGQVDLYEGENECNYEEYGIRIMVRFRDNSELQPLDAHTQSGGERAVSTAVYMLSLQELTDVPFRVVDEINQGMDSSNERRVFDLLVSTISTTNSAQYFLLTPKLLDNLNYSEATTILNVHNGPYAMHYGLWDVRKFIEQRLQHQDEHSHQSKRRRVSSDPYNDENQDTNAMR